MPGRDEGKDVRWVSLTLPGRGIIQMYLEVEYFTVADISIYIFILFLLFVSQYVF